MKSSSMPLKNFQIYKGTLVLTKGTLSFVQIFSAEIIDFSQGITWCYATLNAFS